MVLVAIGIAASVAERYVVHRSWAVVGETVGDTVANIVVVGNAEDSSDQTHYKCNLHGEDSAENCRTTVAPAKAVENVDTGYWDRNEIHSEPSWFVKLTRNLRSRDYTT